MKIRLFLKLSFLFIFVTIFTFWITRRVIFSKNILVPNVINFHIIKAREILNKKGLNLKIEAKKHNDFYPKEYIIFQYPLAGNLTKCRTIKVIVSSGSKLVRVPNVVEKSFQQAKLELEQNGFFLRRQSYVSSDDISKDFIISQNPLADSFALKNSPVNLLISLGKREEKYFMPNLKGEKLSSIEPIICELEVNINNISYEKRNDLESGIIIRHHPEYGWPVEKKGEISLVLSTKRKVQNDEKKYTIFSYIVKGNFLKRKVRIVLEIEGEEKEIFNSLRLPKEKIILPIERQKNAKVRVYLDGQLDLEEEI